ncbi:hypothetical protein CASFOL_007374 [Castilleja foliolosa]|uniref:Uncharacterized protein n=1 Tax=Castilleja foliolosa TaxID=1961234 RepID=A0ABD3E9X2_9LAMI
MMNESLSCYIEKSKSFDNSSDLISNSAIEDSKDLGKKENPSGFSGYYAVKTKSFSNLTDLPLGDSKDLGKKEHPVNKT